MSFQNVSIVGKSASRREYLGAAEHRGNPEYPVSSSMLRDFAICPKRWLSGYESPETKAKKFGSLLDCMLLTPEQFKDLYSVEPLVYINEDGKEKPWNNNAKAARAWVLEQGAREIVKHSEIIACEKAIGTLLSDEIIRSFCDASDRQVWVRGEWKDQATALTVPVRGMLDLVPRLDSEFLQCIGDLKTTTNAGLHPWARWCSKTGYHIQAALYLDLYCAATGEDRNTFCWIVQENYPPWQSARRICSSEGLALGRREYERLLSNYCQCLKNNHWPDYDEGQEGAQGWSLVKPEVYLSEMALLAPHYAFNSASDVEEQSDAEEDPMDVPS